MGWEEYLVTGCSHANSLILSGKGVPSSLPSRAASCLLSHPFYALPNNAREAWLAIKGSVWPLSTPFTFLEPFPTPFLHPTFSMCPQVTYSSPSFTLLFSASTPLPPPLTMTPTQLYYILDPSYGCYLREMDASVCAC